ncbi:hypothetical protein BDW22DRAFT_1482899 [Trametopsis cervina]|nr:hypothetical protein BDW22DRAFT_1482899 [Trametopsis cervina]
MNYPDAAAREEREQREHFPQRDQQGYRNSIARRDKRRATHESRERAKEEEKATEEVWPSAGEQMTGTFEQIAGHIMRSPSLVEHGKQRKSPSTPTEQPKVKKPLKEKKRGGEKNKA